MIRYGIYLIEIATEKTELKGSKQLSVIYDRTEMKRANQDTQLMKFSFSFISIVQDYYAEKKQAIFYVIGANWMYRIAFAVMKSILA